MNVLTYLFVELNAGFHQVDILVRFNCKKASHGHSIATEVLDNYNIWLIQTDDHKLKVCKTTLTYFNPRSTPMKLVK